MKDGKVHGGFFSNSFGIYGGKVISMSFIFCMDSMLSDLDVSAIILITESLSDKEENRIRKI